MTVFVGLLDQLTLVADHTNCCDRIGSELKAFIPALDNKPVTLKVYFMKDMGSYAAWKATKTTGQYDTKTFEVRARPVNRIENFRPGMSVIMKKKGNKIL